MKSILFFGVSIVLFSTAIPVTHAWSLYTKDQECPIYKMIDGKIKVMTLGIRLRECPDSTIKNPYVNNPIAVCPGQFLWSSATNDFCNDKNYEESYIDFNGNTVLASTLIITSDGKLALKDAPIAPTPPVKPADEKPKEAPPDEKPADNPKPVPDNKENPIAKPTLKPITCPLENPKKENQFLDEKAFKSSCAENKINDDAFNNLGNSLQCNVRNTFECQYYPNNVVCDPTAFGSDMFDVIEKCEALDGVITEKNRSFDRCYEKNNGPQIDVFVLDKKDFNKACAAEKGEVRPVKLPSLFICSGKNNLIGLNVCGFEFAGALCPLQRNDIKNGTYDELIKDETKKRCMELGGEGSFIKEEPDSFFCDSPNKTVYAKNVCAYTDPKPGYKPCVRPLGI